MGHRNLARVWTDEHTFRSGYQLPGRLPRRFDNLTHSSQQLVAERQTEALFIHAVKAKFHCPVINPR
jgi:hypothetical protein